MKLVALFLPAVLLGAATSVVAQAPASLDPAAVQRCRMIPEAAARLACYDAIALPGIGSRAGWGAPVATSPTTPPAATAAATPGNAPIGDFGLPRPAAEATDRVVSRIVGKVEDFPKDLRLTLENGQVWQLSEAASGYYNLQNPQVTITRGLLSGFLMAIEGVNAPLRVRRLK
jgi:hypothetical protein